MNVKDRTIYDENTNPHKYSDLVKFEAKIIYDKNNMPISYLNISELACNAIECIYIGSTRYNVVFGIDDITKKNTYYLEPETVIFDAEITGRATDYNSDSEIEINNNVLPEYEEDKPQKTCNKCNNTFSESYYYKFKKNDKYYSRNTCISCEKSRRRQYNKLYYKKNGKLK